MNRLLSHIVYLLLRHNIVSVPELGVFNVGFSSASFASDKFSSPKLHIRFYNDCIADKDSILFSYIRKYGVSFQKAKILISHDVKNLKEKLSRGEKIQISDFGFLFLNETKQIEFVQNPENFAIMFPELSDLITKNENLDIENKIEKNLKNLSGKDYYYFKIRKRLAKVSAASVLFIITILGVILNPVNFGNRNFTASLLDNPELLQLSQSQENLTVENPEDFSIINETEDQKYFLIIASFKTVEEANKFISETGNLDAELNVVPSKKLSRVSIAESFDRESLQRRLNSKEIRDKYPSAWIWSSK